MPVRSRLLGVVVLSGLVACGHGEPFPTPGPGSQVPLAGGVPARLTYSARSDSEPAWFPDGSGLLYSAQRADFPDTTACLEVLPPAGGQATRSICPEVPRADSTRGIQAGSVSPSGRLAFVLSARSHLNLGWSTRKLMLTSLEHGAPWTVLLVLPSVGSVPSHNGVAQIRWLDDDRFVYRADDYEIFIPCNGCRPLERETGRFLVLVDLRTDPPSFTMLPGTAGVTSVALLGPDAVLFTRGDANVYREVLSTGVVSIYWTFGFGIADAVQLTGDRLAAVVNGQVQVVNLTAGTTQLLDTLAYNPLLALSPDGRRLVAHRNGDLWLFDLP